MRTSKFIGSVVCVLAAVGCAAPATGEDQGSSNSALEASGAYFSPLADGLYTDDLHDYLRVFPRDGNVYTGNLAYERVQWDFDGSQGEGNSNYGADRVNVDVASTCASCDSDTSLKLHKVDGGLRVQVIGGRSGAPKQLTLRAVDYSTLDKTYHPSGAQGFAVAITRASNEGMDVTVSGPGVSSTQHLGWVENYFVSAQSTDCGGLTYERNQLHILMQMSPLSDACQAFEALHDAIGDVRVALGPGK